MKNVDLFNKLVQEVDLSKEISSAYLDYSLSVIINRALPDARDGLKPVQRRILFAMRKAGYDWSKPYKKSAGTVGDTLKNYHPHGNAPVYEAMVRMTQPFSLKIPLIDGQGNFGSLDGDPPAAERYTEARLAAESRYILHERDMDAVPYEPNYDNSTEMAQVLPVRFPNLLVNGASGIAVGMATNIPPHNPSEAIQACIALLDNPDMTVQDLMEYVKGPDFPLGGEICDSYQGLLDAYTTGRGWCVLRGKYDLTEKSIVITSIPYQVNKAKLVENIAELVKEGYLDEVADLRDESTEEGVRIVVEIKRDADSNVAVNKLLNKTQLQVKVHFNMLAVLNQQPMQLNLKQMLQIFLEFREEVVITRTLNSLNAARQQAHRLWGLALALSKIDEIIACIKQAEDAKAAEHDLMQIKWGMDVAGPFLRLLEVGYDEDIDGYYFSQAQAKAILELRLQKLTKLEYDQLQQQVNELVELIMQLSRILNDRSVRIALMKEELEQTEQAIGSKRITDITTKSVYLDDEDLIKDESMVVTLSLSGYIKRTQMDEYKIQHRGGRGKISGTLREDDVFSVLINATNHTKLLYFSNIGKVYLTKVYQLPQASTISKGKAIVNILPLEKGELITSITPLLDQQTSIIFVTEQGKIRKNDHSSFEKVQNNGKRAMNADEILVDALSVSNQDHLLLTTYGGKSIRFAVDMLRTMQSRESAGVIGMRLQRNDKVVSVVKISGNDEGLGSVRGSEGVNELGSMRGSELGSVSEGVRGSELGSDEGSRVNNEGLGKQNVNDQQWILTISTKGFGKRTLASEYRCANRGGMGVISMNVTKKTGNVLKSVCVMAGDELILLTKNGLLIRIACDGIRETGRGTQGVTLVKLDKDDVVVNASVVASEGELEKMYEGMLDE